MMPPTVREGASLGVIHEADMFFEGPVWDPVGGNLYFTACRQELILRWDGESVSVWREETGGINGMFLSREGRLLGAQVFGHRVVSLEPGDPASAEIQTLAEDESWNQPNDVCQSPQGDIYFSDPSWSDHSKSAVYRLSRQGEVTRVISDMAVPNGLITSLDGRTLYVGDSHRKHWRAYPIHDDGSVGEGRLFLDPPTEDRSDPDGMTIDERGNLYLSGRGGVWVVSPSGEPLGLIPVPEFCSNVTFGGPEGDQLFLTCRGRVYRLAMNVRGGGADRAVSSDPDRREGDRRQP